MTDYINRLKKAIKNTHKSESKHLDSVGVTEIFQGKIIWEGDVERFSLDNHPKAKTCFAWSHNEKADPVEYFAVLLIPPIDTPKKAVQLSIALYGNE